MGFHRPTLRPVNLRATTSVVAGRPVVNLFGAVDLATVPALQNALARALVDHPGETITIDLDGVDSLDDVGLGILLGAAGRARSHGGDVVVATGNDTVRQRLAITGFDRAVSVTPSLSA